MFVFLFVFLLGKQWILVENLSKKIIKNLSKINKKKSYSKIDLKKYFKNTEKTLCPTHRKIVKQNKKDLLRKKNNKLYKKVSNFSIPRL